MTMARVFGRVRFARALRSRRFAWLWSGQTISAVGDGAFFTALAWQVLLLTRSATAMGAALVAQSIPLVIFMLVGGVVADRLPRRLTLLWSDGGRAVVTLLVAVLGFSGRLQFWHLITLAALFGLAEAFFRPAFQSIPPELVPVEDLPSANALSSFTRSVTTLVGPAIGAALVSIASPAGAFAFDGVTFVISAVCLVMMGRVDGQTKRVDAAEGHEASAAVADIAPLGPLTALAEAALAVERTETTTLLATEPTAEPAAASASHGLRGVLADIREGVAYVTGSTWLWLTIALASLGNVAFAPLQVALPRLVHDTFHQGVWLLGAILTSVSIGSILATLVVGQFKRIRHRGVVAYVSLVVSSAAVALIGAPLGVFGVRPLIGGLAAGPALALASGAVVGIGLGVFEIIWATTMQELVPPDKLGRVSSVDWLGSLCLQPVGLAVVGALTDAIGPAWVFVVGGSFSVLLTLFGLTARGIRQLD
ncbi:MAG TPA: MFS transporter [Ktedonobacterales bacterium]|jgi:MFS family permease|nr:MFS transporter [Ktedonobacterales bacterium]